MSEITIATMTEADVESAIDIDLEAFAPGELGIKDEDPRSARRRHFREELARTWARVRVASDASGRVLGYTLVWHVADEVQLLNVAVTISARRRGIGRLLMDDLIARARGSAEKVLLEVRATNTAAIAMYEALGFERFNLRARYYSDGEDAVEMMLSLTK